ncbi:DNA binding [Striga hermonthica]|uniref:DNA binding n=1 Tax=Striga hermonthica TaxID=68872 RepID=A0A9N7R1N1_STRHE|nr:DNA binding [Striga hermonthica]
MCGKNQKGSSLWSRIAQMFEQARLENPEEIGKRNLDSMKGRYKRLNENINKWRGAYMEAYRNKRSGMSMKDVEKEDHIIYEAGGSKFTDLHVFEEVMRKHPKWELKLDRDSTRSRPEDEASNEESHGSSKRSRTTENGDYSIPSNQETPVSDGFVIPRPEGRDKAKKKGKKVASQSSSIPDEFTAEIRALRLTRKNECDLMTKISNDRMELERKKEERKIRKMNIMVLNTLLAKDHLSPEDEEMKRHLTSISFGK